MKHLIKLSGISVLALSLVLLARTASASHVTDLGAIEAGEGMELEPGKWYHGFDYCKKYAEENGIPFFAIWTSRDCGICRGVVEKLKSPEFKAWQETDEGKIIYCILAGGIYEEDRQFGPAYMWMKDGKLTQYPFVTLYWKDGDTVKANIHKQGYWITSGGGGSGPQKIISHIQEAFPGWKYDPRLPEEDQWDLTDDLAETATPIQVSEKTAVSGPHYMSETDTNDWYAITFDPAVTETNTLWLTDFKLDSKKAAVADLKAHVAFFREEAVPSETKEVDDYQVTNSVTNICTKTVDVAFTNTFPAPAMGKIRLPAKGENGFRDAFYDEESGTYSFVYADRISYVVTNWVDYGCETTKTVVVSWKTNLVPVASCKFDDNGLFAMGKGPDLTDDSQKFFVDEFGKIQISGIKNLYMRVARVPGNVQDPVRLQYTLNARKYLLQNADFAVMRGNVPGLTNAVTCAEQSKTLQLAVVCKGEFRENLTGKLKFIDDTAVLGKNYALPKETESFVKKGFSWEPNSTNPFTVEIKDDRKWNPSQSFKIQIVPDDTSVNLKNDGILEVSITEVSRPNNGTIALSSYVDPKTGKKNSVSSSTVITLSEGTGFPLAVTRSKGMDEAVEAALVWEDGRRIANFTWDTLTDGERKTTVTIPVKVGYQGPREHVAKLVVVSKNADVQSSKGSIRFMVYDSAYGSSIADYYRAKKPDVQMKTKDDDWFISSEKDEYTSYEGGTMTTSLKGPGILSFRASGNLEGLAALIQRVDELPISLAESDDEIVSLVIPSGSKTIELSYKGDGEKPIALSDLKFIPLSAAAEPIAPLAKAAVLEGANLFSWSSITLPGVHADTKIVRYDTGETISCGAASSTNLVLKPMRSFSWSTLVVVNDDFGHSAEIASKKQSSITVLPRGAPDFNYAEDMPMGPEGEWQEDGGGVVFDDLYVGVFAHLGPIAFANNADGVKKLTGSLPSGLKIETIEGKTYITGYPTKAVTNTCVLQAVSGRTAGVTIPATFKIAALPVGAVGEFIGIGTVGAASVGVDGTEEEVDSAVSNGVMTVTISSSGKITGSIPLGGKKFSFKEDGFNWADHGKASTGFRVATVLEYGKVLYPIELHLAVPNDGQNRSVLSISGTEGSVEGDDVTCGFDAICYRNPWKDREKPEVLSKLEGYYTALINPEGNDRFGAGYLTFTISNKGSVKVAGKLADGTSVSSSGVLLQSDSEDCAQICFGGNPSPYKGGEFVGRVAIELNTKEISGAASWINRDENGFACNPPIEGGFYGGSKSLYDVYDISGDEKEMFTSLFFDYGCLGGVKAVISSNGGGVKLDDNGKNIIKSYKYSFKVTPNTGLYTGSITLDGTKCSIAGVLTPSLCEKVGTSDLFLGFEGTLGSGYCLDPKKGTSEVFELYSACEGCGEGE